MKVYYLNDLEDPDIEYGADDWDELPLFIHPEDKPKVDSEVVMIYNLGDGWTRINQHMNIATWPYELPERAKQRFLEACFLIV